MRIAKMFTRQLSSVDFDAGMGQLACWAASLLMLVLGVFKLVALPLTETELFFGVLIVLAVALLGVNLGMLVRIDGKLHRRDRN